MACPPKFISIFQSLKPVNIALFVPQKGVFENITMLKILTWRDCPGLSGSALDAITCVFMKGRQRNIRYSQRKE